MALQGWDKNYREQLKIQEQEIESLQQQLMISGGREPNPDDAPYRPAPIPNPGKPPWPGYPNPPKLAGGPQLPNFKPMGRVIEGTRRGVLPMNETKIKQPLQIGPQASATSRQIRDRLKMFTRGGAYDDQGGSLRGIPDALRIQLLRDAMAQNLPANNIRRLRDSGHKTDYTGGFVLGDDGQLVPVMGIIKADASNNIRRLNESGHQTVLDPITGQLKIVKTL